MPVGFTGLLDIYVGMLDLMCFGIPIFDFQRPSTQPTLPTINYSKCFQFRSTEQIFKAFKTQNYEYATLFPIISVTCHKAMLLIGEFA